MLRTLKDANINGKTVLYRSPYDIGVKKVNGEVVLADDARMVATLPTLTYLLERNCKIVILTHVKRPNGIDENLRTTPHAKHLSKLLDRPVEKLNDCIGDEVRAHILAMEPQDIVMLENTRFYREDNLDDDGFAKELARNGEIVVFDGFPQAHRNQASVTGIMRHLPSYAGLYFQREYEELSKVLSFVNHPFTVIIGGAKISDKIEAIENLYSIADTFLLGGGVANVFLKAKDVAIGGSYIEENTVDDRSRRDWIEFARNLLKRDSPKDGTVRKIHVPIDGMVGLVGSTSGDFRAESLTDTILSISNEEAIYDIGPRTLDLYRSVIANSRTVFWNGPLGLTEDERFDDGSKAIARTLAHSNAYTIIAGGDTIDVANDVTELSFFSHVSLAGGATLEFLSGNRLPAVQLLSS